MALVAWARLQHVSQDPSARDVVELFKPLAPLPDNVGCSRIRNGYGHEVMVGLSLLREGLCKVEGEAFRSYRGVPSWLAWLSKGQEQPECMPCLW